MIASYAESLLLFRGPLLSALKASGLRLHVAAPDLPLNHPLRERLVAKGLTVHTIPMRRTGTNPLADLITLVAIYRVIVRVRPRWVFSYTIKPVIYGTLAGWLAAVPHRFALITGLGYAFQGDGQRGKLRSVVQTLYSIALSRAHKVFFQNPDDKELFRSRGILSERIPSLIVSGSGVDVAEYAVAGPPVAPLRFLLIARLLGDKGVREYVAAASLIRLQYPTIGFDLVGWIDENPDSISQAELNRWIADGTVNFLGKLSDVRPAIAACSVYVLPSYREGTPRTVLEAMAMGRAIITTDAPGCRETVINGVNGFLVPVQSVDALFIAMKRFIDEPDLTVQMGAKSREIAVEKYDVHKVNAVLLREMGIDTTSSNDNS